MQAIYDGILNDVEISQQPAISEDRARVSFFARRLLLQSNAQGQSAARGDATRTASVVARGDGSSVAHRLYQRVRISCSHAVRRA